MIKTVGTVAKKGVIMRISFCYEIYKFRKAKGCARPTSMAASNGLRLDKILSKFGYCSRSQARKFLREHEVMVAGSRMLGPAEKVGTVVCGAIWKRRML